MQEFEERVSAGHAAVGATGDAVCATGCDEGCHEAHSHEGAASNVERSEHFHSDHAPHEAHSHEGQARHHHHSHAAGSQHAGGHHLLQVQNLSVAFRMYDPDAPFFKAKQRFVKVISDLNVSVHAGEILAIVGASGSGKTLLADAIMGQFEPNSQVTGEIWFDGQRQDAASLAALRGRGISLVPQSVNHLNPLMKVGKQVEGFGYSADEAAARADMRKQLFARYGLEESVAELYPHELSGGMARRVLLCCALMDAPKLIVADEPTPGLDLPLALKALADFREFADQGGGVLLITHDIQLALGIADRVAVFKDGTVVEEAPVSAFASPETLEHPFTRALWHALPEHDFHVYGNDERFDVGESAVGSGCSDDGESAVGFAERTSIKREEGPC